MNKLQRLLSPYIKKLQHWLQDIPPDIRKQMLLCLAASLLLTLLAFLSGLGPGILKDGRGLLRKGYGGSKQTVSLEVSGIREDASVPLEITVSPKRYTREEADAVFREVYEQIEELVVTEGESFAGLQHDLHLPTELPEYGIDLSWDFCPELDTDAVVGQSETTDLSAGTAETEAAAVDGSETASEKDSGPSEEAAGDASSADAERREAAREYYQTYRHILDSDGTLHNETLPAGTIVTGYLSLIMSADIVPEDAEDTAKYLKTQYHSEPRRIYINILPRTLSKSEALLLQLKQAITSQDEGSLGEDMLTLPTEIDGQRISYQEPTDRSYLLLPLLGIVAAMAVYMRQAQLKREEKKTRDTLLMLDYSELVSKLMVYIGAGLTIRTAIETISEHYDALIRRGIKEDRPLYRELRTMLVQLKRNQPESEVYLAFGRRVNLKPYTKLISLIEQNRRNGSRSLRAMLELELEDAFEQRKTTARRLGEEAGTKLLLPLFLMLGIVMVIVIVPAMTAMS